MPAQTITSGAAFYAQGDTAPNLRRRLLNGDGTPIDLGDVPDDADVTIDIGYSSYSYYYSPMRKIVSAGPCIVEQPQSDPDVMGWVQWAPQPGDLDTPGDMLYRFKITYPDSTVQHVPPHTYESLTISTPVGGPE